MELVLVILFTSLLTIILIYSLVQLNLLINYYGRSKGQGDPKPSQFPKVTIQLPLYNEQPVVERLLDQVSRIRYPRDLLEVQVLDDSTDDSVVLTAGIIERLRQKGLSIYHLRRPHRQGFKAGALKAGLQTANGELIAIFDADFLPGEDWLLKTVPYFSNAKIGVVQTRWGHLNRNYSLLTRLQAFLLDFHFILEQGGRNAGNYFINFNGTAGIWRKQCIIEAGNWQGDTLTEDLDLSYRAQLRGWKFKYLESVETPAELPITITAARSQQFRWNKGAAENFQKIYKRVLSHPGIPIGTKIHCFFHLLNSSLFLLVLLLALLSVPLIFLQPGQLQEVFGWILTFFSLSTMIFFIAYWVSYSSLEGTTFRSFIKYTFLFLTFLSIAMGFSVHNSFAVLEGHMGRSSDFIRTPKFNVPQGMRYEHKQPVRISLYLVLEIFMLLLISFAIYSGIKLGTYQLMFFHIMLFFGFSYVVFTTLSTGRFQHAIKPMPARKLPPNA